MNCTLKIIHKNLPEFWQSNYKPSEEQPDNYDGQVVFWDTLINEHI